MNRVIRALAVPLVLAATLAVAGPHLADAQDKKDKPKATATTAVFEVYKDRGGEFRFRLKDADGNLLAVAGKGYDKKADCQAVIDAIKKEAAKAKVEDEAK
jgi:uncharacterized protein YegP (UPF0339 family)